MLHWTHLFVIYRDKLQHMKKLFSKLLNFVARVLSLCFSRAAEMLGREVGVTKDPSLCLGYTMGKYPSKLNS